MRLLKQGTRLFMLILLISIMSGCSEQDVKKVSLERKVALQPPSSAKRQQVLRLGMGAMITPKEGYVYYLRLKEYLENKLSMKINLVDRDNYDQVNKMLADGEVDAAFVCSGPYVEGHEKFGLELMAVPLVKQGPIYYSLIIVPLSSPAKKLSDLRGKTFAFTDPKSNSGKLVPTFMLSKMKETPDTFFKKYVYTYGHDKSIKAVAEGLVDGAAVDSLIWEFMVRKDPLLNKNVRIVQRSDPYGIPPLVCRPGLNPSLKKAIQDQLFAMHENPEGKKILEGMALQRFSPGNDRDYDTIREMNSWLKLQAGRN